MSNRGKFRIEPFKHRVELDGQVRTRDGRSFHGPRMTDHRAVQTHGHPTQPGASNAPPDFGAFLGARSRGFRVIGILLRGHPLTPGAHALPNKIKHITFGFSWHLIDAASYLVVKVTHTDTPYPSLPSHIKTF
jgi:hypothetical protein